MSVLGLHPSTYPTNFLPHFPQYGPSTAGQQQQQPEAPTGTNRMTNGTGNGGTGGADSTNSSQQSLTGTGSGTATEGGDQTPIFSNLAVSESSHLDSSTSSASSSISSTSG